MGREARQKPVALRLGKKLRAREAGQIVVCLGREHHEKNGSAVSWEKIGREAPEKQTTAAQPGKNAVRSAASLGKFFQLCRDKKILFSYSRNRYLTPVIDPTEAI